MAESSSSRLTRAKNRMPAYVREALRREGLLEAYQERPPYQRNDYLGWIARARLPATQQKRLRQMLDELRGGKRYMNMAWKPRA